MATPLYITPQNPRNEAGYALVLSMITLVLLSSLGLAAVYQSNSEVKVVGNERLGNSLLMAADSGTELGKNVIWTQSGFGANANVSFQNLDNFFAALNLPLVMAPVPLAGNTYYQVTVPNQVTVPGQANPVSGYDASDASQRVITFQSRGWIDGNANGTYDTGEQSRVVTSRVSFQYGSLSFPYGVLTQNTECVFCHAKIVGDVVSLSQITVRKMDEAYSTILGKVYTMGTTNLDQPLSRVVADYVDQDGDLTTVENAGETPLDITTGFSDPNRFPLDANGNPSFPKIENMTYYEGLASSYKGGTGSSLNGGTIQGVALGSTYAGGLGNLGNVSQTYTGNLILTGTPGNCIQLDGPVVVRGGDLVISGCVTGQGSLYVEGNVYTAASVTYQNPATDKLALAAGGNIVIGDYRNTQAFKGTPQDTGGGKFVNKQFYTFNTDQLTLPIGQRRFYAADDGSVYTSSGTTINPGAGDKVVSYTPSLTGPGGAQWITDANFVANLADTVNGVTQLDAMAYTANGIFGINKVGTKKMTINGALVSADIGILIPGQAGKNKDYDPANIGLTLVYDSRMQSFLNVAQNPTKKTLSWREGI